MLAEVFLLDCLNSYTILDYSTISKLLYYAAIIIRNNDSKADNCKKLKHTPVNGNNTITVFAKRRNFSEFHTSINIKTNDKIY